MTTAIEFRNVSRRFMLSQNRPRSLQEAMIRLLSFRRPPTREEEFWALKDVSFAIEKGQLVGLIGTNGSGKSTALKLMAGIMPPTGGEIKVHGRLSALLELGSGMHPDLTGRENIFLNGSLLGISNAEMRKLYPKILSFSELDRFIDMPIKHYSSGMYMRLGFSVAVHVQPDILLLDEVLTVGDQSFQAKCLEHLYEIRKRGTTIVLVSHGLESIRTICTELIWLKDGELIEQGSPVIVSEAYLREINRASAARDELAEPEVEEESFLRWGSRELEIRAVRLFNGQGKATDTFLTGDSFRVEIDYRAHRPEYNPMVGLAIHRADGTHINGPNTCFAGLDLGLVEGDGTVSYTIPDLPLMSGLYDLTIAIHDTSGLHPFDVHGRAYQFRINAGGTREQYGLLRIPAAWDHHTSQGGEPRPEAIPSAVLHI